MPDYGPPRPPAPTLLCYVCGEGIWKATDLTLEDGRTAHIACLERETGNPLALDPLTGDERSRLTRNCWDHEVAVCGLCSRKYRLTEMGSDLTRGQYHFCPFCRVDLTWSIRQHIAACTVIRHNDPRWQTEVREALAHAREARKTSQQLRDAAELARIESELLLTRAREVAEAARQAQEKSEQIKREAQGGG